MNTGKVFVLFDDGNGLSLREAANMKTNVVLGDRSLVTDYKYETDIDKQTYNSIKLVRENEETGMADVVEAKDTANICLLYTSVRGYYSSVRRCACGQVFISKRSRQWRRGEDLRYQKWKAK